jgi:hypothetical protein
MKITVDMKKILPDNHGEAIWAPGVIADYRLIDVDYLYRDNMAEPACRIENAVILAALFTADACRFVVYRDIGGKWLASGINVSGEYSGSPGSFLLKLKANRNRKTWLSVAAGLSWDGESIPASLMSVLMGSFSYTRIKQS